MEKAEALSKLKQAREILKEKNNIENAIRATEDMIEDLRKESSEGAKHWSLYSTNHAESVRKEVESEHQAAAERKRKSTKWIMIVAWVLVGCMPIIDWLVAKLLHTYWPEEYSGMALFYQGVKYFLFATAPFVCGLGVLCFVLPASRIRRGIVRKTDRWSQEQLDRLKEAEKLDQENTKLNWQQKIQKNAELREKNNKIIAQLQAKREEYDSQIRQFDQKVEALDILGPDDCDHVIVERLIQIFESHRAETLQEAFMVYDAKTARDHAEFKRDLEAQWRREEARMAEERRAQAEERHRSRLEAEARKQTEELERIRKDNEYYQRYGTPR